MITTAVTTGVTVGGIQIADQIPNENIKLILQIVIAVVGLVKMFLPPKAVRQQRREERRARREEKKKD